VHSIFIGGIQPIYFEVLPDTRRYVAQIMAWIHVTVFSVTLLNMLIASLWVAYDEYTAVCAHFASALLCDFTSLTCFC